ncbi:hypothetical protein [Halorubrum lipolyticum]|uniref:Uncharacterized protein n=1 Tax=Halorubrum lipolyticum DSM 21995 TaxID=1227482 RepID=M0NH45_9EURY|nr:hypothetical protein [Halorubrum lipolyticum]EMA57166.1 hypothetical protein C469_15578 [Halorubrum lipolyticum DSM 21995]
MIDGILYPAAATITATSGLATVAFVASMWERQKRQHRALFGEEGVEAHEGLLQRVAEHRQALREGDLL